MVSDCDTDNGTLLHMTITVANTVTLLHLLIIAVSIL